MRDRKVLLNGQKILLVEDCPDQQRLFAYFLTIAGATVTFECDGYAAIRTYLKSHVAGEPFNAVVMDLRLSQSDGIVTTAEIVAADANAAIVALTVHGSKEVEWCWRSAGCQVYLEKPISAEQLVRGVLQAQALRDHSCEINQTPSTRDLSALVPRPV